MKQHTLNKEFSFTGKGLHTGLTINVSFCPAPENFGIQLCRIDLPNRPVSRASAEFVTDTSRGTVLENGEWKISTVEHALAALSAMGIDNCLININGPEMPILDGSAKFYAEAIKSVGLKEQNEDRKVLVITEPIHFENESSGSVIDIYPAETTSLEVTIDFASEILGKQTAYLNDVSGFVEEIASARTFCFVREIEPLLKLGYIKGGDLQNAIVIYDQKLSQEAFDEMANKLGAPKQNANKLGYLCNLNYENEPARHKLLDLIGDLSLVGRPIQGRIVAYRPGHTTNTKFAKQLRNNI